MLGVAMIAASALGACKPESEADPDKKFHAQINQKFTEGRKFAGDIEVDAATLQDGHDAYMLYCYACHGVFGDGHGPSSYGLRPPPRDFTKGIFKFARLRSSDDVPNDEDISRIVLGGLHGTAMLPWNIPEIELDKVIQYIKTFAPEKWEKKKKNGEMVKTLEKFEAPEDPWDTDDEAGWKSGRDLYHFRAECVNCHPAYGTKKELFDWSSAAAKRDPANFKVVGGFREDPYNPVAKDSPEYKQRILPPDFTFNNVRSARPGKELVDLFRLISYGVYPVMPAWKGAGLSDKDIWALAHYVKHLIDLKDTKELADMREAFATQAVFVLPKAEEPKKEEPPPADAEKKDEPKPEDAKPAESAAPEAPKPPEKVAPPPPAKPAPAKPAPAKAAAPAKPAAKPAPKKKDDIY
jgi:mono/diheme cytochrome c family protein